MNLDDFLRLYPEPLKGPTSKGWHNGRCVGHDDRSPSFGVKAGETGLILKCQAGCPLDAILDALKIDIRDLFYGETPISSRPIRERLRLEAEYPYPEADGTVRLMKQRFRRPDGGKTFAWVHRNGSGAWESGKGDRPRYLYHLPSVIEAVRFGRPVLLVEGEKDADTATEFGWTATTTPEKASVDAEILAPVRNGEVIIIGDNDGSGREYVSAAVKLLPRARVLGLPGVERKGDLSDWASGQTDPAAELRALIERLWEASPSREVPRLEVSSSVDVGCLLDEVARHVRRFVVLSADQATLCALWVLHAHAIAAADATPYLVVTSPERRCGKSRLLEVLRGLAHSPWYVVRPSEPVLFRKLATGATLFLDEVDTIFSTAAKDSTEGIRATLNAGFERGAVVSRCADHGRDLEDFEVFGPKVLAGIGDPPDTVKDRGFTLSLRRARRSEARERFRRRMAGPVADELRGRIESWAKSEATIAALKGAEPALPEALNDRAQDAAEPLLAIADLAGGGWPARARDALVGLAGEAAVDEVDDSSGVALLRDLVTVFGRLGSPKHATSEVLVRELRESEGSPWGKMNKGDGLDMVGLSRLLRPFKVRSWNTKTSDGKVRKGYRRAEVLDAAERYVPAVPDEQEDDYTSSSREDAATAATPLQRARNEVFRPLPGPLPGPLPDGSADPGDAAGRPEKGTRTPLADFVQ